MQLFRFKDQSFTEIEPVTLSQLDLKNKKTLFIFPGAENATPANLTGENEKFASKMKKLLKRGVIYSQDAQIARKALDEPYQVILATWENYPECMKRLEYLRDAPAKFVSSEAKEFVAALYAQGFDPNKISVLGWSYGSCFLQECANEIRLQGKSLPPIYAVCVATVTNPANNSINGFPGFYMYAWNDKVLEKYTDSKTKRLYDMALSPRAYTDSKYNNRIIKSLERHDHIIAVVTAPNHLLRYQREPLTLQQMVDAVATPMVYKPRKDPSTGKPLFDDDTPENIQRCDYCHMPGGFMEVIDLLKN